MLGFGALASLVLDTEQLTMNGTVPQLEQTDGQG